MSDPQLPLCNIDDLIDHLHMLRRVYGNITVAFNGLEQDLAVGTQVRQSNHGVRTRLFLAANEAGASVDPVSVADKVVAGPPAEISEVRYAEFSRGGVVAAVSPGDSRCCHRRCPHVNMTKTSCACDLFGGSLAKVSGPALNLGSESDAWFRTTACLSTFGG